jgi:8-oxo-dGTP pyrophosphatase MutT (NUDIX family)
MRTSFSLGLSSGILLTFARPKICFRIIRLLGGLVKNSKRNIVYFRNGLRDLPKGKLERGETYQEGALREVSEECGIRGLFNAQRLHTFHVPS